MKDMLIVWLLYCLAPALSQCPQSTPPAKGMKYTHQPERSPDSLLGDTTDVYPVDPKFDCAIRNMALEYAGKVLKHVPDTETALKQVHDALDLTACKMMGHAYSTPHQFVDLGKSRDGHPWDVAPVQYFVSPNGSDSNEGTYKSPWNTITRARDEIRKTPGVTTTRICQ